MNVEAFCAAAHAWLDEHKQNAPPDYGAIVPAEDVLAFMAHDSGRILGRTASGTLELRADDRGLAFELALPDTADGRDLGVRLRRGEREMPRSILQVIRDLGELGVKSATPRGRELGVRCR